MSDTAEALLKQIRQSKAQELSADVSQGAEVYQKQ
jgi:hypothetical protein